MAHHEDGMFKYISIILFNCFCFTIVTVSWFPCVSKQKDVYMSVCILYSITMLTGLGATVKAYMDSNPRPGRQQTKKPSYVRIACMFIFLVAMLILDMLSILQSLHCINFMIELRCGRFIDKVGNATMMCIRIVYVGTQTIYILWLAPKIRRSETNGVSSWSHLLNVAVNVALLIHNLIFESKSIIFHEEPGHTMPLCENIKNRADLENLRQCWNSTIGFAEMRDKVEEILRPMVTEYFFLSSAILISQWLALRGSDSDFSETDERPRDSRSSDQREIVEETVLGRLSQSSELRETGEETEPRRVRQSREPRETGEETEPRRVRQSREPRVTGEETERRRTSQTIEPRESGEEIEHRRVTSASSSREANGGGTGRLREFDRDYTSLSELSPVNQHHIMSRVACYGSVELRDSINQRTSDTNDVMTESQSRRTSQPSEIGLNCSFFIMLILTIATNIAGFSDIRGVGPSVFIFDGLLIIDFSIGSFIMLRIALNSTNIYRRLNQQQDIRISYEHLIFLTSSAGVFIYDFAKALPNMVAFFYPPLQEDIANLPTNISSVDSTIHQVLDLAVCGGEVIMTMLSVLIVVILQDDRHQRYLDRFGLPSFRAYLCILVLGSLSFWLYRSSLWRVSSAASKIVPKLFYTANTWNVIVSLATPLAVYFHFHCALVFFEYLVKCLTSRN